MPFAQRPSCRVFAPYVACDVIAAADPRTHRSPSCLTPASCFRVVRRPHLSVRMCCHAPPFAQCVGPSMMPTFSPSGDIVVLDRFSPKFVGYELGDVVVARSATNPKQTVCKRILGMVRWEASIGVIDSALDCTLRVSVSMRARLWSRDCTWQIRTELGVYRSACISCGDCRKLR